MLLGKFAQFENETALIKKRKKLSELSRKIAEFINEFKFVPDLEMQRSP